MDTIDIWVHGTANHHRHGRINLAAWGAVILKDGRTFTLSGSANDTTAARMELTACIEALKRIDRPYRIRMFVANAYIRDAMAWGWVERWQASGWRKSSGAPARHPDLFTELLRLIAPHQVAWLAPGPRGYKTAAQNAAMSAIDASLKHPAYPRARSTVSWVGAV